MKANGRLTMFSVSRTFVNKMINFLGVGVALYAIASLYGMVTNDSIVKHTVKCRYCRKRISEKVRWSLNFSDSASTDLV